METFLSWFMVIAAKFGKFTLKKITAIEHQVSDKLIKKKQKITILYTLNEN